MLPMKKLNEKYADIVRENFAQNLESGMAQVQYMEKSTAVYHGRPVACLYLPKLFSQEARDYLKNAASTICGILDKIIAQYLSDAQYRRLFPFPKELEELILTEAGYTTLLPIARLDIFFNEDDFSFKFCEFNADGASAMNENREIAAAVSQSHAMREFQQEYDIASFELFDSWVREFSEIYAGYEKKSGGKTDTPLIVITDFMEAATPNEFIEFRKAFEKAGYETEICEIRKLKYENGSLLTPEGKKIDAVYRRAVTCDIMCHKADVQPFLQAARENATCIVGHFRTQVIHNKAVFAIMRKPETLSFLTENEREYVLRHIPETLWLNQGEFDLAHVLSYKDEWIIKPDDLYGSRGVFAGVDMTAQDWEHAVKNAIGTGYLLQKFCQPYRTQNLNFNGNPHPDFETFNNITGMFVYNGKLAGLYSRAGQCGVISSDMQGLTLASLVANHQSSPSTQ